MTNSGIIWIDTIFNWCVKLLYDLATFTGITYEEINVHLFVIISPLVLFFSILLNIFLLSKLALKSASNNPYHSTKLTAKTQRNHHPLLNKRLL